MIPGSLDETLMRRCLDLATRGVGAVSPNPPVGALIVESGEIIGEGWHGFFGGPHAEVKAVASVAPENRHRIPGSTLYVSLEPCCISGKTPACTDLILRERIREVVVSTTDPNPSVGGNGLALLSRHGVTVRTGILEKEGQHLIRAFNVNILEGRPYITLKWAQSREGLYAPRSGRQWLSEPYTRTFSHRLRAAADAILVGAGTILADDPALTTRDYPGRSPARILFDPNGRIPANISALAPDGIRVFHVSRKETPAPLAGRVISIPLDANPTGLDQCFRHLFREGIGHILVEGGATLQKLLVGQGLWDEAWVIRTATSLDDGMTAPAVTGRLIRSFRTGQDTITGILRA